MTKRGRKWVLAGGIALAVMTAAAAIRYQNGKVAVKPDESNLPKGLQFRLSEGKAPTESTPNRTTAPAEPLSDADAERLLARLPQIKAQNDDTQSFALRKSSLPAPRAGKTIEVPFPPPPSEVTKPTVPQGPLEVRRMQPEGDVPIADRISITFSQPMVPVTTQDAAARSVPVQLSPQPQSGRWRWLGTQTLIFDAGQGKRLPMATEYTVTIPAGTKSETGGVLAQDAKLVFCTPAVRLISSWPPSNTPQPRDPVLWLAFDQRVDPATIAKSVVLANGTDEAKTYPLRLATTLEVGRVAELRGRSDIPADRVVALKPVEPLPAATGFVVRVEPGTTSLEGPRRTDSPQNFTFATYAPLKVEYVEGDGRTPDETWQIQFNNPLDQEAFDPSWVKITPAAPRIQVMANGQYLFLSGPKRGRTTYTVALAPQLKDVFGQTLGATKPLTFRVGPARPWLSGPQAGFQVLDPGAEPRVVFSSVNVPTAQVKCFAVTPSDWSVWLKWINGGPRRGLPPGRLVYEHTIGLKQTPDDLSETSLSLRPALPQGTGNVIVWWQSSVVRPNEQEPDRGAAWLQATRLGVSVHADATDLYAWATRLADGKPVAEAQVSLLGTDLQKSTQADGLAHLTLTTQGSPGLVVRSGNDAAFFPSRFWEYGDLPWKKQSRQDQWRWFVFDDRKLYKPGETVHLKGWLRRQPSGKLTDLTLPPTTGPLRYILRDSRGNESAKGQANLNALGGFDFTLALGKTFNLGQASVQLIAPSAAMIHTFQVEEFRRPEFEVAAKVTTAGPHLVGGAGAELEATASYYAGGPLPGAATNWNVSASPTTYTPPGRGEFTFGRWVPWWESASDDGEGDVMVFGRGFGRPGFGQPNVSKQFAGITDGAGTHRLHIDFDSVRPARPYSLSAQATIQDVNRQAWSASTSVLVHPSERYVGLRGKKLFVEKGKPLAIDAIVCDIDGKLDTGTEIAFRAVRTEWGYVKGRWQNREIESKEWSVRSGKAAVTTEFVPKEGGTWKVRAQVRDRKERLNETEITLWVAGGKPEKRQQLGQETVQLIPSQKEYQPGQTAEILVRAPFAPAEALVTLRRDGLVKVERVTLKEATYTLKIPIDERYLPNITLQVDLVGAAQRDEAKGITRPAFAAGSINLAVATTSRRLTVVATPEAARTEPGAKTRVNVQLKDASGKPVANADAAVIVVDESVLALGGWSLGDPLGAFYPQHGTDSYDQYLRANVLLEDPALVRDEKRRAGRPGGPGGFAGGMMGGGGGRVMNMAAPASAAPAFDSLMVPKVASRLREMAKLKDGDSGVDNGRDESGGEPIRLRENFGALAAFVGSVKTDADGTARVPVTLPDNLTRYRVIAVAVAGAKQIGSGEANLTARLPLMARPSAPRFLNFGDQFELPVIVQNQTDAPMTVEVAVRATNATLTAGKGRRVRVAANDRVEVRFPTEAAQAGTARFQVAAAAGSKADAAEVSLPVWTPATTEAFATYGVVDDGAIAQPVEAPGSVVPQFGGLEVTTSSTALQELTDAFIYLNQYPYGCAEQIASRVLADVALRDVLTAFKAEGMPAPEALNAAIGRDLKRLEELQNDDGSFGFWVRGSKPWPYLGVHVAHALARARQKDYSVPDAMWQRSQTYLRQIDSHFDADYSESCRRMIKAYALYVRAQMGENELYPEARQLLKAAPLDHLGPETVGWLVSVLAKDGLAANQLIDARRWLDNKVTETAGAAHYAFSYSDGNYLVLHSDRRADAIVLDAVMADRPQSDLIPKLVRGLLDGRKQGRWESTQENAFVLLALDRYFRTYEKVTPNFVARLWLGDKLAGEGTFAGRTTDRVESRVPMRTLTEKAGKQTLTVAKEGPGRLYYRIGMRYAPKSLTLLPADYGLAVSRTYEAIEKPTDVRRSDDGTWVIRAGAKVRVRVQLVATTRRYHVALVDPLPAGFEALNPELRGTEWVPESSQPARIAGGRWPFWMWWHWWEHQNLRDERAEAFTSYLWEGAYEYTYVCRATTPGLFVVPPTKAEEMYSPETFGRSGTDRVKIE